MSTPIPKTMKVAIIHAFGDVRIEEMPVPSPVAGEALMRVRASGICSGDVMPWYIEKKAPIVLGHEPAGEIVAVGDGVTAFSPGERIFVHHHAPCFACRHCGRGDYVQCSTWREPGIHPGGIAEYVLIPKHTLEADTLPLPDGVGFEDAALVEPLACAVKALKRARVRRGDTALVIGLGVMGLLNVLALAKYGAGRVIGADFDAFRREKALALGANEVIDPADEDTAAALARLTDGHLAEVVVVGPNSVEALNTGINSVASGGTVLMFTPVKPGETLTLDPNELYFRDISLVPSYSCGPTDTADALELIASGVVRAEMVVTHRLPIERTNEAYRLTAEGGTALKCLIVFD
jgi:L-iditol 2-dehydrogenase